jgi:glucose-6-phosphate 1-dehydrogenase
MNLVVTSYIKNMTKSIIMVIFGATGNLTKIKLLPALYHINQYALPEQFKILAVGRRPLTTAQYLSDQYEYLSTNLKPFSNQKWETLSNKISYLSMDIEQPNDYIQLSQWINQQPVDEVIYYFATAPDLFATISASLAQHQLADQTKYKLKVMIEKPFGYDLASANQYQKALQHVFPEELIYRIDHYLGKEMVQSIMYLRFANRVFNQVWNGENIKSIQIIADENIGIEGRGKYYDMTGAMRDMLQSHLFQILTLLTMNEPVSFNSQDLLHNKLEVLKQLTFTKDDVVFGQYRGYQLESNVNEQSTTETFVALHCKINNSNWQNTDFYLRTGKYMDTKAIEIIIEFKEVSNKLLNVPNTNNVLVIKIQPEEGVYFHFNSKEPGVNTIRTNSLSYCQSCAINYRSVEAYEYLIKEVLEGNHASFAHWQEVAISWAHIDLLTSWKQSLPLHQYEKYSTGPQASDYLLTNHQTRWQKGKYQ